MLEVLSYTEQYPGRKYVTAKKAKRIIDKLRQRYDVVDVRMSWWRKNVVVITYWNENV